jgi:hypothetical protein
MRNTLLLLATGVLATACGDNLPAEPDAGCELACDPDAGADGPDATPIPCSESLDVLVDCYESGDISRDEFRSAIAAMPDSGIASELTDISETTLLKPRDEPYTVAAELTVAADAILVIQGGAEVVIADSVLFRVEGRLYAIGSEDDTVIIRGDESTGRFESLQLRSGPNQLVWAEMWHGKRMLALKDNFDNPARTLAEHVRFDSWGVVAVDQIDSGSFVVRYSQFGFETTPENVFGEMIRSRRSGDMLIEDNDFSYRRGYLDVIDLQDCGDGYWPIIINNRLDGGEDDAIDLDQCPAYVIGNHITNFTPINLESMVGGVNGGGITGDGPKSTPIIINNVIDGCYHGIGFKNGAAPIIINNTIINSNIGITLYQSDVTEEMPHGVVYNNILANNLGWLNGGLPNEIVLNGKWWPSYNQVDDVQATIDATYNITATLAAPYIGEGNLSDDPMLEMIDGVPVPMTGSPAIDSGLGTITVDSGSVDEVIRYLSADFRGDARTETMGEFLTIDRGAVEAED